MNLVMAPRAAQVPDCLPAPGEPATAVRAFLDASLSLDDADRIFEAARLHGVRLGGTDISDADWVRFTNTWIDGFAHWDDPTERTHLGSVLAGFLDAVTLPGMPLGARVLDLVGRIFASQPEEPEDPFGRANALCAMLDMLRGVMLACDMPALDAACLRQLLEAIDPMPELLGPHDARRWLDAQDLSHVTLALTQGAGGLHASAAQRHELLSHVLADWRTGDDLYAHLYSLVAGLGGLQMPDGVRLELLDRLLSDTGHAPQHLDACLWLVGGDPSDFRGSVAQVLRAGGPLLPGRGVRLVHALASSAIARGDPPQLVPEALSLAADAWPRSMAVELGAAAGHALGAGTLNNAQFAAWLQSASPDAASPGRRGSREAVALGLQMARDPLVAWEAPGLTAADRVALLERIFAQPRLMQDLVASRSLARILTIDASPAQRRTLLTALFTHAGELLPPEACSLARLVLSREMSDLDEDERQASIDAIATIMRTWSSWTTPLTLAVTLGPVEHGWHARTLEWHERVRLELAGPAETLDHPEVAARLADYLRDLMEQLALALTRWEQAGAVAGQAWLVEAIEDADEI